MYVSFMTLCTSVQLKNMYTSVVICLTVRPLRALRTTLRRRVIRRIYKIGCSGLYFSARTGYKTSRMRIGATIAAAQLVREEGSELNLL